MQEASASAKRYMYLPFRKVIRSFSYNSDFAYWLLCLTIWNPKATPFELFALLLFVLPLVLTLQKFVELPLLGERFSE